MQYKFSKYNICFDSISGKKVIFNLHKRVPVALSGESEWLIMQVNSGAMYIDVMGKSLIFPISL